MSPPSDSMAAMETGADEAGRGAWAGPLFVGVVTLGQAAIPRLSDSKRLSRGYRLAVYNHIRQFAKSIGVGFSTSAEVDALGLTAATRLALKRALTQLDGFERLIIDGSYNFLSEHPQTIAVVKADGSIPCVMAASVVAKVCRDQYMVRLAKTYPNYGFDRHVGYGTLYHRQALEKFGLTVEHRRSFRPVAAL